MTKIAEVIGLLEGENKLTQKEIAEKVGCSEGYVSRTRKGLDTKQAAVDEEAEIDDGVNEHKFIRPVKIVPDQDVLTDKDDVVEPDETDYECGGCGHVWHASKTERQSECPECGEEFE